VVEDRALPQIDHPTRSALLELWREGRRPFILRLEGNSMSPVALSGDRVTIQPVTPEQLRSGDIVALHQGDAVVVHRLVMARTAGAGSYCQKGDNSPIWTRVGANAVLGRVTVIHGPDRLVQLCRRPWTWINPLAGRLGRVGMLSPRLGRVLLVLLIRLGLRWRN
jgi:hypothetical protein